MLGRRGTCVAIVLLFMPLGVVWRMAPLGLPPFLYKYGGSVLWAAMVYWLVAALLPCLTPTKVAALAAFVSALVELSRLFHTPSLDAFRTTLAGKLILGRFFSQRDIAAYWLAIALDRGRNSPSQIPHTGVTAKTSEPFQRLKQKRFQMRAFAHCSGHLLHWNFGNSEFAV